MTKLEEITELDRLCEAFKAVRKASAWKSSTQRYGADVIMQSLKLQRDVRSGKYQQGELLHFTLNERGKERDIHAPTVRDRVLQKVVNQDILLKCPRKYLIYDNFASLTGRGTALARKRHLIHLRKFIAEHGPDGYVLQIDIHHYFESINHSTCWQMVGPHIPESVRPLVRYLIDNAAEGNAGLNLGSEVPQTLAVYYLHPVDDYCKIVKGVKFYGRYMDDIYIFGKSKTELRELLAGVKAQLAALHLEVNERKTHIIKLSHGYVFMQLKYRILPNGKVLVTPAPAKITRERRKLKAYKRLRDAGKLSMREIQNAYKSWRQCIIKDCSCVRSVLNLDALYEELFGEAPGRNRKSDSQRTRWSIPDAPGEKRYIMAETPFTARIGIYI